MGFHGTFFDVEHLLRKKEYDKALNIVKEHLASEHQFESDLSILSRKVHSFQEGIVVLMHSIEEAKKGVPVPHMEHHWLRPQNEIIAIKQLLKKLLREEKISLE